VEQGRIRDARPVVIVGGGPTGVAAATLLAQRGVHSVVL
jgi:2-polyprenyl-6-methoxyphenol hydroxylase-like FAD-dependent oxidoreductase